jgi:division/cell wall cluster transcriptional repressor MraZ
MAAGGALCLFTVVLSFKVREGNRCSASGESASLPVVPVPPPPDKAKDDIKAPVDKAPADMKPLPPEQGNPLPPIGEGVRTPDPRPSGPADVPSVPAIDVKPITSLLPAVQPAPPTAAPPESPPAAPPAVTPPMPTVNMDPPAPPPAPAPKPEVKPMAPPPPELKTPVTPPTVTPTVQVQHPMKEADPLVSPPTATPVREPGEPPLAPQPGPVVKYRVREGGETLPEIARHTLGASERWVELVRLNPSLPHDSAISAGTLVRLPADACVPTEGIEVVKPLPALKPFKPEPGQPKVVLPLCGTFPCNLDDHRTLLLPKSIRDQLGSTDTMLISPGPDQCLWLTNQAHLERLAQRLEQSGAKEVDVRTFKRLYFAQTEKVMLTAEGRVVISDRLAQFAGLGQEVVLVGIDDHFELWDVARWKDFTQKKSAAARANIAAEQD